MGQRTGGKLKRESEVRRSRERAEISDLRPPIYPRYVFAISLAGAVLSVFITIISWFYWVPGNRVELVANASILIAFLLTAMMSVKDLRRIQVTHDP